MKYLSLNICLITATLCTAVQASGIRPIIVVTSGMSSHLGQNSQSLTFANTTFTYQPDSASPISPLVGLFAGAEYPFYTNLIWQSGLGLYQNTATSINGSEIQAPISAPNAVNLWDYQYNIMSRQLFFENKLLLRLKNHYLPWLSLGLGESFNYAYEFQTTPQNTGEVATAVYSDYLNKNFSYMISFGLDIDITKNTRLGAGYRLDYLGRYDLGKGTLDTGAGGSVFSLPALKSDYSYSSQVFINMTYLF